MPTVRFLALEQTMGRKPNNFKAPESRVSEYFGSHVFNIKAMREYMTSEAFKAVVDAMENGSKIFAISTKAPIYKVLEGKTTGDTFTFNEEEHKITGIE